LLTTTLPGVGGLYLGPVGRGLYPPTGGSGLGPLGGLYLGPVGLVGDGAGLVTTGPCQGREVGAGGLYLGPEGLEGAGPGL